MRRLHVSHLCLWATLFCLCQHVFSDTLVIEKVQCKQSATGIDNFAIAGAAAIGAVIAGGITAAGGVGVILGTGGAGAPVTFGAIFKAAASGAKGGASALKFLNTQTSGTDDLIININGEHVWPVDGGHGSVSAGENVTMNVRFDFDGAARIQLIEYDSGSDNDDLGSIDVNTDVEPGKDYRIVDAVALSKEEGDLYYVTYRVERNDKGKGEAKYQLCGTAACKICKDDPCCKTTSNQGLDRDGDKPDLKSCPPGFTDKGWKTWDLAWPAEDVYLRICGNQYASEATCDVPTIHSSGWSRRMVDTSMVKQRLRQRILRKLGLQYGIFP